MEIALESVGVPVHNICVLVVVDPLILEIALIVLAVLHIHVSVRRIMIVLVHIHVGVLSYVQIAAHNILIHIVHQRVLLHVQVRFVTLFGRVRLVHVVGMVIVIQIIAAVHVNPQRQRQVEEVTPVVLVHLIMYVLTLIAVPLPLPQ